MKKKDQVQNYINFDNHKYLNNKGITLLVLAITIIVMLILAGVTISISMNNDGIINKTISSIARLEVSEEKDVLAVAHSALLMKQELYDDEITESALQDKISEGGKESVVTRHEDDEGILVVKFRKTGNIYWIRIENGEIEYKGTNTEKWDETVIQKGDIIFASEPNDWTKENVSTTITVRDEIDMSDFVLQWTKTPEDKKSWQNYESGTKIISEKKEKISARIREKNTDKTKAKNEKNIDFIDKKAPDGTLAVESITTNTATVKVTATDEATEEYGASGIKGFYYSKDDGATWSDITKETTYQFTKLIQTNEYKFKVKIEDKVGNTQIVGTDATTGTVPTPTDANLRHTTTWSGTNATVTFTTTAGFWIQTSTDGINWTDTNPVTVPSGTTIYVRYSDSEDINEEGTNKGPQYAAVRPLWTGTVNYDANGGTGGPSPQNIQHTKVVTVNFLNKPVRAGYIFQGWNTKADGTGTNYTQNGTKTFTMGTSNITLYAVWQSTEIYTTFDSYATGGATISSDKQILSMGVGGGSVSGTFSLVPGATVRSEITSSSYDQGDTSAEMRILVNGTKHSSLQTTGTLTYTNTGASNVTITIEISAGGMDTNTTVTFAGGEKGQFKADTCTVTCDANGGSGAPAAQTVFKGTSMYPSSSPIRTGYTFKGWSTSQNGPPMGPIKITSNTTWYAVWEANVYTITLNNQSATSAGTTAVYCKYGDGIYLERECIHKMTTTSNPITTPKKTGYTFEGYTDSPDLLINSSGYGTNLFLSVNKLTNDVTIYAGWRSNTYTVNYYNGTTKLGSSTHSYGTAKNLTTISALGGSKSGYTFAGWTTSTNATTANYSDGKSVNNLTTTNGGTITLYAIWKRNVTFYHGINKASTNTAVQYFNSKGGNYSVTTPSSITSATTADGWETLGWRDDTTAGEKEIIAGANSTSSSNVFYAVYSRKAYCISGINNQHNQITMQYYNSNNNYAIQLPNTAVAISGWTTLGWRGDTKADIQTAALGATGGTSARRIYAVYKRTLTVSYNANGGTLPSGSSAPTTQTSVQYYNAYGTITSPTFTLPTCTWTRIGYSFKGWSTSQTATSGTAAGGRVTFNPAVGSTGDTNVKRTYYAVWGANAYTISYNLNSGTQGSSAPTSATYGKAFKVDNPTRTGYTFAGWNITGMDTCIGSYGTYVSETNVSPYTTKNTTTLSGVKANGFYCLRATSGTVTFTATWTANTYVVKYNGNGSTGGSTANSSHTYGTAKTLTANGFTRTGHTFAGWNTKADGTGTSYTNKQSVKNLTSTAGGTVTLYAQWLKDTIAPTIAVSKTVASDKYSATLSATATDNSPGTGVRYFKYAPGKRTTEYMENSGKNVNGTITVKFDEAYFKEVYGTNLSQKDFTECYYTFYAVDNAGNKRTYQYRLTGLLLQICFTGKNGLAIIGGSINSTTGAITINHSVAGSAQYGPYIKIPKGSYEAAWEGNFPNYGTHFDVTTDEANTTIASVTNEYSNYVAVKFNLTSPVDMIEMRCTGASASGSTRIDKVLLKQTNF